MEHIVIDEKLNIHIPESLKTIPQYNHNVQTYTIDCPRFTQNGEDMLKMVPFISVEKKGVKEPVSVACTAPELDATDENIVHFNWTIKREVSDTVGKIGIVVCVRRSEEENLENAWHTFRNEEIEIKKGIDCGLDMLMQYPGLIEEILYRLGIVEKSGGAVPDKTLTISGAPADAKVVGDRCSQLQQTINNYGIYVGDTQPTNGVMYWLDTSEDTEEEPDTPVEPDVPEDATLSSISATYTGGDVTVGTALSSLTGITVTATYSDGTSKTVTDYTLSGEIAEGENTITVSYGGKTTTFKVTGVAESGGDNNVDLSESNVFASSTGDIILNKSSSPLYDDFIGLDVEKLYFYAESSDQYNHTMNIKAQFTSSWGSLIIAQKITITQATDGTYDFITNGWEKYNDYGYTIFEIDVQKLKEKIQSLYDDGSLDSAKEKGLVFSFNGQSAEGSTRYLLYNYKG